jgi:hypothetical protein
MEPGTEQAWQRERIIAMQPGLGTFVEYRDRDNRTKVALVTATSATVAEGDRVAAPQPGRAHLLIFSFSGSTYANHNVRPGDGPSTFDVPEGLETVFFDSEAAQELEQAENDSAADSLL